MSDEAKVRFLFRKVQHDGLRSSIDALKALETAGTVITYTMAANHLSTAVSELPEYLAKNARNVSGVQLQAGNETGGSRIHNEDGSIITGDIPHWGSLSLQEKRIVFNERKRLGIQYKKKGGAGAGGRGRKNQSDANQLKRLKKRNSKYKRTIKALRRNQEGDDEDAMRTLMLAINLAERTPRRRRRGVSEW